MTDGAIFLSIAQGVGFSPIVTKYSFNFSIQGKISQIKSKSQDEKSLLKLIRDQMRKLGITQQKELAQKCKVSTGAINRFFNGKGIAAHNVYKILSTLGLLTAPESKLSNGDYILLALEAEKAKKPDIDTINARVGKAVEQLTGILLSGDTNITKALLTALDSFVFYQKKSQAIKSRLENTDNTIKEVKKILRENMPPKGVKERRECWIKINELLT